MSKHDGELYTMKDGIYDLASGDIGQLHMKAPCDGRLITLGLNILGLDPGVNVNGKAVDGPTWRRDGSSLYAFSYVPVRTGDPICVTVGNPSVATEMILARIVMERKDFVEPPAEPKTGRLTLQWKERDELRETIQLLRESNQEILRDHHAQKEELQDAQDESIRLRQKLTKLQQERAYEKVGDMARERGFANAAIASAARITKLAMLSDGGTVLDFQKRWGRR